MYTDDHLQTLLDIITAGKAPATFPPQGHIPKGFFDATFSIVYDEHDIFVPSFDGNDIFVI